MEVIKGRMYDYNNGRFLSVDPFIQSPTSTQSMNPYTYIFNNPLSGTDPSGYCSEGKDRLGCNKKSKEGESRKEQKKRRQHNRDSSRGAITVYNGSTYNGVDVNKVAKEVNKAISTLGSQVRKQLNNASTRQEKIHVLNTSLEIKKLNELLSFRSRLNLFIELTEKACKTGCSDTGTIPVEMVDVFVSLTESFGINVSMSTLGGGSTTTSRTVTTRTAVSQADEGVIPLVNGRKPINSKFAGTVHPSGVPFKNTGFPDFGEFKVAQVKIGNLTGQSSDFVKANRAAGFKNTPDGFTWHHVEDGATMQLVPTKIHNAARHTGGAAILRNQQ